MGLTQRAAKALETLSTERNLTAGHGLRLSGRPRPDGGLDIQMGFAAAPARSDTVEEQYGVRVFLAAEVATPLADAEIDLREDPEGRGTESAKLVVRKVRSGSA